MFPNGIQISLPIPIVTFGITRIATYRAARATNLTAHHSTATAITTITTTISYIVASRRTSVNLVIIKGRRTSGWCRSKYFVIVKWCGYLKCCNCGCEICSWAAIRIRGWCGWTCNNNTGRIIVNNSSIIRYSGGRCSGIFFRSRVTARALCRGFLYEFVSTVGHKGFHSERCNRTNCISVPFKIVLLHQKDLQLGHLSHFRRWLPSERVLF
mmetsp:Transcript_36742/g.89156  ORF Transcript_36742/g.89156 Transcript_36742/m.89156 type:complete len:212 (+) Transcript_36742:569-1204(+)